MGKLLVSQQLPLSVLAQAQRFMDDLRLEFSAVSQLWTVLWTRVSIHDEIAMCVEPLQLRPNCLTNKWEEHKFVDDIAAKLREVTEDHLRKKDIFKEAMGNLTYVVGLNTTKALHRECPVCYDTLGQLYNVLSCGHTICIACCQTLVNRSARSIIACPSCRRNTDVRSIKKVNCAVGECKMYSSKVRSVVVTIVTILRDDSTNKIIVFSQWPELLCMLNTAFASIDMPGAARFILVCSKKDLPQALHLLKTQITMNVLLMPLSCGANGLNVVEANHVLLMEPLLSQGIEQQAICRVHRLGQTRETFVHRFVATVTIKVAIATLSARHIQLAGKGLLVTNHQEFSTLSARDIANLFTD